VESTLYFVDKDVKEREERLQGKHEMEWSCLEDRIADLKAALPPPPSFGPPQPGEPDIITHYAPQSASKRARERELAMEQKYEQAPLEPARIIKPKHTLTIHMNPYPHSYPSPEILP